MSNSGISYDANFKLRVACGAVPGWTRLRKFGMNDAVNGSSTLEDCWPPGTIRVLPSAAAVVAVSSDSPDDDADPAGTGAWTVTIEGLNDNGREISETVSLNGTSTVNTTASFYRINRAYVVTAGTGEVNAGNISMSIGGDLQAYIEDSEGQTHQTLYTVPSNKYLLIDSYYARVGRIAGTADANVYGQIKLNAPNSAWRTISDIYLASGGVHQNPADVTVIPPFTELRMQIRSSATTQLTGIFSGYLVETRYFGGI